MENKNKSRLSVMWLLVLILFICVAATTIGLLRIMNGYLPDDSGAIPLIPANNAGTGEEIIPQEDSSVTQTTAPPQKPGFEVSDDQTEWETETRVEIFKIAYENDQQTITVKGAGGDKVIAPGTENSYTFKLKNTGNVALRYTVEIDAYCAPSGLSIPITGRIRRYDGAWILGDGERFADAAALDAAEDNAALGAGRYAYYTLDWTWPFEGDDVLDTLLGSQAAEQDLTFTLVITTTATEHEDPNNDTGLDSPQTGEKSHVTLWIVLAGGSFIILLFLLFSKDKKE